MERQRKAEAEERARSEEAARKAAEEAAAAEAATEQRKARQLEKKATQKERSRLRSLCSDMGAPLALSKHSPDPSIISHALLARLYLLLTVLGCADTSALCMACEHVHRG